MEQVKKKQRVVQLNPAKLRQENGKLRGKFRTLNDDYSAYKRTVKDVVGEEKYKEIIAKLCGVTDE